MAVAVFKDALAQHGFKLELNRSDELFCEVTFVNGARYVQISASIHSHDYPWYFTIALGEGPLDFGEADWNSIGLWRLREMVAPDAAEGDYRLRGKSRYRRQLEDARVELLNYATDFLTGDVTLFRKARSEQNRERKPYQVHSPDKNGNYVVTDDPKSKAMKKKYS